MGNEQFNKKRRGRWKRISENINATGGISDAMNFVFNAGMTSVCKVPAPQMPSIVHHVE